MVKFFVRTVATGFGLLPAVVGACIWAPVELPMATTSNVAESTVLMTNPGMIKG